VANQDRDRIGPQDVIRRTEGSVQEDDRSTPTTETTDPRKAPTSASAAATTFELGSDPVM
jgi:hypothetical protein